MQMEFIMQKQKTDSEVDTGNADENQ